MPKLPGPSVKTYMDSARMGKKKLAQDMKEGWHRFMQEDQRTLDRGVTLAAREHAKKQVAKKGSYGGFAARRSLGKNTLPLKNRLTK